MPFSASGPNGSPQLHLQAANKDVSAQENCSRRRSHVPRGRDARARRQYRHRKRYSALSGGHAPIGRFTADAADKGPFMAAAREIFRCGLRAARAAPAFENPGLGERQSGRAEADDVLHVQRSGLPLCRRVLLEGHDLCAERAGAARFGARFHAIAARRCSAPRSTMSSARWARFSVSAFSLPGK